MPSIYLQKDLGIIGDFMHSYRKDIADEFVKNSHLYKLPKDHFTKFVPKTHKKEFNHNPWIKTGRINYYFNIFKGLIKGRKNMYETMRNHTAREIGSLGAWQMKPLLFNQNWVWEPANKIETVTWQQHEGITFGTTSTYDTIKQCYPKLTEMIDKLRSKYGIDSVNKVTYSILIANGNIGVHTGRDNIHSKYVRCHIPLIIPEHTRDELHLEAGGDKVYWTETWGFDNQTPHTAKNDTNYHRLVLIIDISRDALCITKKKKSSKGFAYIKRLAKIYTNLGKEYN